MCVDITDFSMIVSLSSFFDETQRTDITVRLFETFCIPAIYTINSNVSGIFSEGRTSGVVVDSGYSGTYALNIFEGYPVNDNEVRSNVGGKYMD